MMLPMLEIVHVQRHRGRIAASILKRLPEWFGIPASVDAYVADCESLPMAAARVATGGEFVGFLSLKQHTRAAAEILVMGVLRNHHRRGIGRALIADVEHSLCAVGTRYLTVKTLAPSNADPNYAKTREFYEALGFEPIEVFATLWGEDNPCLMMLRRLA